MKTSKYCTDRTFHCAVRFCCTVVLQCMLSSCLRKSTLYTMKFNTVQFNSVQFSSVQFSSGQSLGPYVHTPLVDGYFELVSLQKFDAFEGFSYFKSDEEVKLSILVR